MTARVGCDDATHATQQLDLRLPHSVIEGSTVQQYDGRRGRNMLGLTGVEYGDVPVGNRHVDEFSHDNQVVIDLRL